MHHLDLQQKEMKLLLILIVCAGCISEAYGQPKSFIGVGLSDFRYGSVSLSVGHEIAKNWSMEAAIPFGPHSLLKKREEETGMHDTAIRLRFWPSEAFQGVSLSLGYIFPKGPVPQCRIGCAYDIRIWKGLKARLSYEMNVHETDETANRLGIAINQIF